MPVERERKSTVLDTTSVHAIRAASRSAAEKAAAVKAVEQTVTVDPPPTSITAVDTPTAVGDPPTGKPTTRKRA